ncbi:hypothetical protein [Ferribacterium limneticum]|uniref:hypothetical protein n=1 Tax=Ferribacterium limneticum TaxID=76259 RepID=UPI001CF991E8|nr:hypothetical protein [Ferribacterium limneticum]UCV28414.1 hypothetical protein KI617_19600 [Ferribacterium limneticum]UCV32331.1 hypothetical protein KI608_19600 [Ferribacterium limneticum]
MDYSRFRFLAVVDWVELEVHTLKATQGKHLKAAGTFSHAHGINPQTGEKYDERVKNTTTTRFAIRIQAPERFAAITAALATIRDRLDPSYAIAVLGIEVALDAYAEEGTSPDELAEMTAHFLKGINLVSPDHPRVYRRKGETRAIGSQRELIYALADGFQIGIGNGNGDRFQHGYLKSKDNKQDLPENEHRARIEIRLQGNASPVRTLDDLAGFDFASLSNYFRFRQFDDPQTELERLMAERQICLGNIMDIDGNLAAINRKGGGTRKNKRGTTAGPLNNVARVRLRTLTKRWQAPTGRGKARDKNTFACGNPDRLESQCLLENQPGMASLQHPENQRHCWGNQLPETTPEAQSICTSQNRSLNTSYSPIAHHLADPIKVLCGITSHIELQSLINDLNQPSRSSLPDLSGNPADI